MSVQVYEGHGQAPLGRNQQWEAADHMADDDGVSLYGVDESGGTLQRLQDHVRIYGAVVIDVCVYKNRDHVDMYDNMRVTELERIVCAGGKVNWSIAWGHA